MEHLLRTRVVAGLLQNPTCSSTDEGKESPVAQSRALINHVLDDEGPCFTAEWYRQCMIQTMMDRTGNTERQYRSHQPCYQRCCELVSPLPVLLALGNTAFCTFKENRSSNMVLQGRLRSYMLSVVIWKHMKQQSLSSHHLSAAFLCKNGLQIRSWVWVYFSSPPCNSFMTCTALCLEE